MCDSALQLEMKVEREYDNSIRESNYLTERGTAMHFLGKLSIAGVVLCGIALSSHKLAAQAVPIHVPPVMVSGQEISRHVPPETADGPTASPQIPPGSSTGLAVSTRVPLGMQPGQGTSTHTSLVADWTHHHVLFPESNNSSVMDRFKDDPRRMQSLNIRHPEGWWPKRYPPYRWGVRRDWSVPLGVAYYEPLFDSTFTFVIGTQVGTGTLIAADLGGGELLATAGSLTVTGLLDAGTYSLFPGPPTATASPGGFFHYDDLLFPAQNPVVDNYGLLFLGGGLQVNLFFSGTTDDYSFW